MHIGLQQFFVRQECCFESFGHQSLPILKVIYDESRAWVRQILKQASPFKDKTFDLLLDCICDMPTITNLIYMFICLRAAMLLKYLNNSGNNKRLKLAK